MNIRFKRLALITSLGITLLTPVLSTGTAWADSAVITRGEFIKLIADQLKLAPKNPSAVLPKDVAGDSAYANAVRVMIERHILNGYEDGTFRLGQPITKEESSYILGRFLGIKDSAAEAKLQTSFGVNFGSSAQTSSEAALKMIQSSLSNDEKAVAWVNDSSAKQMEVNSFHSSVDINYKLVMKSGQDTNGKNSMDTPTKTELDFNKNTGIHQLIAVEMPGPSGATKVDVEQYMVKEGTFAKIADPATKEVKWINLTKQIPFTFDQLVDLQKNNSMLNKTFVNPYFFFRDLGSVEIGGVKLHKIEMNGYLTNTADLLKALGGLTSDQSMLQQFANSPAISQMTMAMSATFLFDEQTKLVSSQQASYTISYGDNQVIPIDHMDLSMTATYKDYNKVADIVLPDEAKKAEELPAMEMPVPAK